MLFQFKDNPAPGSVVGIGLYQHPVSGEHPDPMQPHFTGHVTEQHLCSTYLDPKSGVGQIFQYDTFHLWVIRIC